MDKQPILSLCIPTNGAVEWVLPVIDSIFTQGYDKSKFEVIVTDNGKNSLLPEYIDKMNYPNLHYKQTNDEGFLNLVSCLKLGKGMFCKMINHRSIMSPNSISEMVSLVEKYHDTQPVIYCASGNCKFDGEIMECPDTDTFVRNLSYFCSWSAGIGFWQKDIPHLYDVELDIMFPNTSLLFEVRKDTQYVIWNKEYQKMTDDVGKGGYDVFYTFGVRLLDILNNLRISGRISVNTFSHVKKDLYVFLKRLYFNEVVMPTNHTFIIQNVSESMEVYYGRYYYNRMVIWARFRKPFSILKRRMRYLLNLNGLKVKHTM